MNRPENSPSTRESSTTDPVVDGVRFCARFTPQAWVRDYAIDVDPEGETTWDCTRAVTENLPYFQRILTAGYDGDWDDPVSGLLDNDDALADDPDAPTWVREWSGPFSIHVYRHTDETT